MSKADERAQRSFDKLADMGVSISFHPSLVTPRPDTPQANLSLAVGRGLEEMQKARDAAMPTRACTGAQCREQIIDVTLVRQDGKRVRHVFDPEPEEGGKYVIETDLLGETTARYDAAAKTGYVSHFATCPNSPQFRGQR